MLLRCIFKVENPALLDSFNPQPPRHGEENAMPRPASPQVRTALAALGAVLMLGAACSGRSLSEYGVGPGDFGWFENRDCDSDGSMLATPPPITPLPADAVLVSATRCQFPQQRVLGDGEWLMRIEQKATSGLDALAAAVRLPSEQKGAGQACPAIANPPVGNPPIVITVTDTAGRQIHPAIPHAACGEPLKATTDVIASLPWTQVSMSKVRQTRSELELLSGCPGSRKPVIALTAAEGSGTQIVAAVPTVGASRVCRYEPDPDPADVISLDNGTAYRMGKLASWYLMDPGRSAELMGAVGIAPKATGTCARPEAPFAVLDLVDNFRPWVTVERGGCYRAVVDGENYVRQLDAALVSRLVG